MKQIVYWLAIVQLLMISCSKKDKPAPAPSYYLRLSAVSIQASPVAGQVTGVKVEANSDWKITVPSSGADWLEFNKNNGKGDDSLKIKVLTDNLTGAKRTLTITVALTNGQGEIVQLLIEQAPFVNNVNILWKKVLGGNGNEYPYAVTNNADGSHVIAGSTSSNNYGDVGPTKGGNDFWIVKLSNNGDINWKKTFGGNGNEIATAITATADGGYAVCGHTNSNNNGDVGVNRGGTDYWIIKLDGNGALQWKKTLGGNNDDLPNAITVTSYGTIVVAGATKSNNNGDVGVNHGGEDYWIVALDPANGTVLWKKVLGGNGTETAKAIIPVGDGEVIIGGNTNSNNNGDVSTTKGSGDFWIVRLDKQGNIVWKKIAGGSNMEALSGLALGTGSTFVAVGTTKSNNNGDVGAGKGAEDYWVVQFNTGTGALNWQQVLGGSAADYGRSVAVNSNGHIIVAGHTLSDNSGDVENNQGVADFWLVRLNSNGSIAWKKVMGGSDDEHVYGVSTATDGSHVAVGYTYSNNSGDVGANHGNGDFWAVKLKE